MPTNRPIGIRLCASETDWPGGVDRIALKFLLRPSLTIT